MPEIKIKHQGAHQYEENNYFFENGESFVQMHLQLTCSSITVDRQIDIVLISKSGRCIHVSHSNDMTGYNEILQSPHQANDIDNISLI